jgi:hypothetical protein
MEYFGKLAIILFLVSSCSKSFKTVDPKRFNEIIANRTDIKTAGDLMALYADSNGIGATNIASVKTDDLGSNEYEITLIREKIDDDSQAAEKIVLIALLSGQTWKIIEIRKSWKCWDDRGHTNWGKDACF